MNQQSRQPNRLTVGEIQSEVAKRIAKRCVLCHRDKYGNIIAPHMIQLQTIYLFGGTQLSQQLETRCPLKHRDKEGNIIPPHMLGRYISIAYTNKWSQNCRHIAKINNNNLYEIIHSILNGYLGGMCVSIPKDIHNVLCKYCGVLPKITIYNDRDIIF